LESHRKNLHDHSNSRRTISVLIIFFIYLFGYYQTAGAACTQATSNVTHRFVVTPPGGIGGDCASIGAALNALNSPPTAPTNAWTIEVLPGIYMENLTMKSYVTLQGSGREVTIIQSLNTSLPTITIPGLQNVAIAGFTLIHPSGGGGSVHVIRIDPSNSVSILDNFLSVGNAWGIEVKAPSSTVTISRNIIVGNGFGNTGIYVSNAVGTSSPLISDNLITSLLGAGILTYKTPVILGNVIKGNATVIADNGADPSFTISGNVITNNSANGILSNSTMGVVIVNNRITNNGNGSSTFDLSITTGATVNLSHNVYDTISASGATVNGRFNTKSTGNTCPSVPTPCP
jgi:hypothetical protein